jgi:hypothetical protein
MAYNRILGFDVKPVSPFDLVQKPITTKLLFLAVRDEIHANEKTASGIDG